MPLKSRQTWQGPEEPLGASSLTVDSKKVGIWGSFTGARGCQAGLELISKKGLVGG